MRPKILFIHENEREIHDGLWAALELLKKDFDIMKWQTDLPVIATDEFDLILGWGSFGSEVDRMTRSNYWFSTKKGLCIGGTAGSPDSIHEYDIVFYETQWDYNTRLRATGHENLVHAFGINTNVMRPNSKQNIVFDYLTVGAFSLWKRQLKLVDKRGMKLAVGDIQKNNRVESMLIVDDLVNNGVGVMPQVTEIELARFYAMSHTVYLPAELHGGSERALLEARQMGCNVEVEIDNPKLKELLTSPIWDEQYYAKQLKKGILSCL